MRSSIFFIFLVFHSYFSFAQSADEIQNIEKHFDEILQKEEYYQQQKIEKINTLKNAVKNKNSENRFDINYQIFENYKKLNMDSALVYINKCKNLIPNQQDSINYLINLEIAAIYSTSGQYIEAKNILDAIDRDKIPHNLLTKYFETFRDFYSHYGQSNNNQKFYQISELYRDSVLSVLPKTSTDYRINLAAKNLFSGDRNDSKNELHKLLLEEKNDLKQTAYIAYLLGIFYKHDQNIDLQKYYFTLSAISDIQIANKDNASIQDLALTYYQIGDIDRAFKTIDKSIKDAVFCNVRYRIIEGTSFYPIINAAYQKKINDQNKKLLINIVLISILTLILIGGITLIFKQNSKLKRIKIQLSDTNNQLMRLNAQIQKSNLELTEANYIKEEYIAQFFDMCSTYIEKIDILRKSVLKKVNSNNTAELISDLKSTALIEQEVTDLYLNFDTIFLNLYPYFIDDFNSLLKEDERINPKKGELLNTELRIFALIKLGIDDSVKIANFLRYSLRTVYNYRTKVRNKASGNRDQFEELVKKIGKIDR